MQIALPSHKKIIQQLAPFLLLSLLLHIAFFIFIRPPAKNFPVTQQRPMEVFISIPSEFGHSSLSKEKIDSETRRNPAKLSTVPKMLTRQPTVQIKPISTADEVWNLDLQHLMESAKNIAQDEARKSERDNAAQERKKTNTPAGSLAKNLKQPYKEIRLANGMLKIIYAAGPVCYQAVPIFARDSADLFSIPVTCP